MAQMAQNDTSTSRKPGAANGGTREGPFRLSLRAALVVFVILPLAVALIGVGGLALSEIEREIERRLQEDVELVARAIQPAVGRALEQGRSGSLQQALGAAFSIDRVFGAYVYDSEGAKIAAAGLEGSLPSERRVARLARRGDERGEFGEVAGRQVYSYFVPLTDSGARMIGVLQVTRRASDFEEYVGTLRAQAATATLLALGLATALVLFGHHGAVGSHLLRLTRSMRAVEGGDHGHRAPVAGPGEIARLSESFNAMLDGIQRAEEEIERRREAELELVRRLRRTETLAAIGQLAAGVAHELGTPLSLIYGKAQRLLRSELPEPVTSGLRQTMREVRRMERIVQQLLDYGRRHRTRVRDVRADRLARSALASAVGEESRRETMVTIDGPEPPPTLPVDPFRFERALKNLIENALQASAGGRIAVTWFSGEDEVGFLVEDDGPGIPEEARSRLFEPFFTTKKPGEGTGLGLSLVYRIVDEHGGRIEVGTSTLGGALFRVVLPDTALARGANHAET